MKDDKIKLVAILLAGFHLLTASYVLASDVVGQTAEESVGFEFFFIEITGAAIAIVVLIRMVRTAIILGGHAGKAFNLYAIATGFIAFSLVLRSYIEFYGSETIFTEYVFEISIYMALIFMLFGTNMAKRVICKDIR